MALAQTIELDEALAVTLDSMTALSVGVTVVEVAAWQFGVDVGTGFGTVASQLEVVGPVGEADWTRWEAGVIDVLVLSWSALLVTGRGADVDPGAGSGSMVVGRGSDVDPGVGSGSMVIGRGSDVDPGAGSGSRVVGRGSVIIPGPGSGAVIGRGGGIALVGVSVTECEA